MKSQRERYRQNNFKLFFSLILMLSVSIVGIGQTVKSDKPSAKAIAEPAMKLFVQRVLVWYFKPRNHKKIIYLAEEGIQKSWLPSIRNIEFRLLSAKDIHQSNKKVYFFNKPVSLGNEYDAGFGFGIPECKSSGDNWRFRISKQGIGFGKTEILVLVVLSQVVKVFRL